MNFFTILGFGVLIIGLMLGTFVCGAMLYVTLPKWTIGGDVNKLSDKIVVLALSAVVCFGWYYVAQHISLSVNLN